MGFQDNSGDIIFDVILTDEGRRQLSKGDGSFRITKFKLSDDEINYELFVNNTGSAYQDIQILQSPIFEAFSNNTSNMTNLLVNYTNNNLLYLPVIELNELADGGSKTARHASGSFMVAVDQNTEGTLDENNNGTSLAIQSDNAERTGFLFGATPNRGGYIRIDAGIDNDARPPNSSVPLESDLYETGYMIEIDNRLGRIVNAAGNVFASPQFVDDDNIAVYKFTRSRRGAATPIGPLSNSFVVENTNTSEGASTEVISGLRSTILQFKIASSQELKQSNFYFNKFGDRTTMINKNNAEVANGTRFIDTLIKITGINTGYTLEIPVRFVKLV